MHDVMAAFSDEVTGPPPGAMRRARGAAVMRERAGGGCVVDAACLGPEFEVLGAGRQDQPAQHDRRETSRLKLWAQSFRASARVK